MTIESEIAGTVPGINLSRDICGPAVRYKTGNTECHFGMPIIIMKLKKTFAAATTATTMTTTRKEQEQRQQQERHSSYNSSSKYNFGFMYLLIKR